MLIKKSLIILSYFLLASCTRESGEAIKEVKCQPGQKSWGGLCVTDFDQPAETPAPNFIPTGESDGTYGERPGYVDTSVGGEREETDPSATDPATPDSDPSATESGGSDAVVSDPGVDVPEVPPTTSRPSPSSPTTSGTPTAAGETPAELRVMAKLAQFNPAGGDENNPFIIWAAFEPSDRISDVSVKYIAGATIMHSKAQMAYDVNAKITFKYDGRLCEVQNTVYNFDEYYNSDKEWAGLEVEVLCGGAM